METQLKLSTDTEKQCPKPTGAVLDVATYAVNFRALGFIAWSFHKFSSKDMSEAFNIRRE